MLKIGVAQADFQVAQREANLAILRGLLDKAAQNGVDVLVLPELANSGYNFDTPAEAESVAEVVDEGPACRLLREWSVGGRLAVSGLCERAGDLLFNSAVVYAGGELLSVYRKTHLFANESAFFQPGAQKPPVLEFGGSRFGVMICFDWFFPEMARSLALRGAQIILHPSNLVLPYCQTAMFARCLENRVYAVTTNRFGAEELAGMRLTFTGASQIMSPLGERLGQAPGEGECVLVAEIDPAAADDKHVTAANDLFADRRPEMYQP